MYTRLQIWDVDIQLWDVEITPVLDALVSVTFDLHVRVIICQIEIVPITYTQAISSSHF